eukprot:CAMPEP_0114351022 /NCGR_PEP_ID=MMETSP0101-20121206/16844_1 /TAXON_ID=38822 ORGANISM="Pteridomonas danica, Strain PT" /NCGR_SAMPLE_ID=MMETSP0101 /ASSEMBLY_ACC=CAM_ASM_000211 /LENGTH=345 /DNA_ID=CAMNT_0001490635 /DNA_START=341 /DNA_END=1376 /DNA_ORIENTATION=+
MQSKGVEGNYSSRDSRKAPLVLGGERYTQWKEKLISLERHILKELGFGFYQVMEHPHKYLLYYIKYLSQHGMDASEEKLRLFAQHSWSYLNDSLRLDLCIRQDAKNIACAATLIASRLPDVSLALPTPHWIQALGADPKIVHEVVDKILEAYHLPLVPWMEPLNDQAMMSSKFQNKFDDVEEGKVSIPREVKPTKEQTLSSSVGEESSPAEPPAPSKPVETEDAEKKTKRTKEVKKDIKVHPQTQKKPTKVILDEKMMIVIKMTIVDATIETTDEVTGIIIVETIKGSLRVGTEAIAVGMTDAEMTDAGAAVAVQIARDIASDRGLLKSDNLAWPNFWPGNSNTP